MWGRAAPRGMWNFPVTPSVVEVWSLNHWTTGEAVLNIFFKLFCFKTLFLCLFWAVLALCCYVGFSLASARGGRSLVEVPGSLVAEGGRWARRFQQVWAPGSRVSGCGTRTCCSAACGILLNQESNPFLLHWQVDFFFFFFFITEPQGKPCFGFYI